MAFKRSAYAFIKTAIAASAFLWATVAAQAEIATFATFSSIEQTKNVSLVNLGVGETNRAALYSTRTDVADQFGSVQVRFNFLQSGLSDFVTNVVADFSLNGVITQPSLSQSSYVYQPLLIGTMSFISTTDITLTGRLFETKTFAAGANLLTVDFNGVISGPLMGSTATFEGSTGASNTVAFTSDFLDFSNVNEMDYAATLSAITPRLTLGTNGSLNSFRASIGGSFSSDPAPVLVGTIPEPAGWALMITGFMMLGVAIRQGRRNGSSITITKP